MFGLYISLVLLGLSAVDPVGIGAMPILLAQKHPYRRSLFFLSGSFAALMAMGLLFSRGLGKTMLHFEKQNTWFVPSVEVLGGLSLLGVAIWVYIEQRSGKVSIEPSPRSQKWLALGDWQVFMAGAVIVAIQSIIDIVFVIAMVRVGQIALGAVQLVLAIATYAFSALLIQISIAVAFRVAPPNYRDRILRQVHVLLEKYASRVLITVSLLLSCILFVAAAR